jgi:hypothetical protein
MRSTRHIPADIPKSRIVSSSLEKIDPKRQLREAGYPFDHIGTELIALDGKFEVVSTDVRMMKEDFNRRTTDLTDKITADTAALSNKMEENRNSILEKVEAIFDRKFHIVTGIIIGGIPFIYGGVKYLQGAGVKENVVAFIAMAGGALILGATCLLAKKAK